MFTRMLDNVVEVNGLPLPQQQAEIMRKRRHGMGFLGLGSTVTMLKMKYGGQDSCEFTERIAREMAVAGWEMGLALSQEKGPAPIMEEIFTVTAEMLRKRPEMAKDGWKLGQEIPGKVLHARYSRYMQQVAKVAPELVDNLAESGARFTHHSSIAPTGTISLSLANNASNGIEPSFAHHYSRNVIRGKSREGRVYNYELLAVNSSTARPCRSPTSPRKAAGLLRRRDDISPVERRHPGRRAEMGRFLDLRPPISPPPTPTRTSRTSTATTTGLKGCTTFRFNPAAFQGVLVKEHDLENTLYRFELEDGTTVEVKGNEQIEYDGEMHTAANLFDALKEGYYGKF